MSKKTDEAIKLFSSMVIISAVIFTISKFSLPIPLYISTIFLTLVLLIMLNWKFLKENVVKN